MIKNLVEKYQKFQNNSFINQLNDKEFKKKIYQAQEIRGNLFVIKEILQSFVIIH